MKHLIAGVDVGNATTEIALAEISTDGKPEFIKSGIIPTTGIKGTPDNIKGILKLLTQLTKTEPSWKVSKILLNDATPVIADFAMDTITETIITDSAMIGHNPDTPGGIGLGVGETAVIDEIPSRHADYIVVVPERVGFQEAARLINDAGKKGISITGAILQRDEGTLINNRLNHTIPIVDEVAQIDGVPLGMPCAVEVAAMGHSIRTLSNPYGIASLFQLSPEETRLCGHIARALIGNRSAVVIKTPDSDIETRVIPAGRIEIIGERHSERISVDEGADSIMKAVSRIRKITDVKGEPGTNTGGMFERLRIKMADACSLQPEEIAVSDLFATDSYSSVPVKGGLANEYAMESGVAIAAMVRTDQRFMKNVADRLSKELQIPVEIGGIEAEMACRGVLTTPGVSQPLIMVDIGAGSTDAAYMDQEGQLQTVHLAGAGNLITLLIDSELHINSFDNAEAIKKYPLAKVETLYRIRYEDGNIAFRKTPLPPEYYGQIVTVNPNGEFSIIKTTHSLDKIRSVRRNVKKKVIMPNILRAIDSLGATDTVNKLILIGGTALDFELAGIMTEEMSRLHVLAGQGNVRGTEGPRNAVATGLIMDYCERKGHEYG